MAINPVNPDAPRVATHFATHVAVFAKAPVPGTVKTRLAPALGAHGAARLHRRLVQHAVSVACATAPGDVTLWCAPDTHHPFFGTMAEQHPIGLAKQHGTDLGARMLHAITHHTARGVTLLIGSDCPALTPGHLHAAADALRAGHDAVFIPAEDGGYVLVGLRQPQPTVFADIDWGTPRVMAQTRARLCATDLRWTELPTLWDVDRPDDLTRLAHLNTNYQEIS